MENKKLFIKNLTQNSVKNTINICGAKKALT